MKLKNLIYKLEKKQVIGNIEYNIQGVVEDSRKVKKDFLFIATKGITHDSHNYIGKAIESGAVAIIGEIKPKDEWLEKHIAYVQVSDSRKALGEVAAVWYGNPSEKMKVIGVTGTDGKTTTSLFLYQILKSAGKKVGLICTVGAFINDKKQDTGLHVTNPVSLELQNLLHEMQKQNVEIAIIEVTSHGIDQHRIAGIDFDTAILTNITPEHLDYHKNFENLVNVKSKLFEKANIQILNIDDKSGVKFAKKYKKSSISYSSKIKSDFQFKQIGKKMNLINNNKNYFLKTNINEIYNLYNLTTAIACSRTLRVNWNKIIKASENLKLPKGRLDYIKNKKKIDIIVDFAHTPNSVESVLKELRKVCRGKLIVAHGTAGERDSQKRKNMGSASTSNADLVIFTAEDPRSEKVSQIIEQMVAGLGNKNKYLIIKERGEAIYKAIIEIAKPKDMVAILGKGHEKSMNYNGTEHPWSDFKAVEYALNNKILTISK